MYRFLNTLNSKVLPGSPLNPRLAYGVFKALSKRIIHDISGTPYGPDRNSVNIICHNHRLLICGIPKVATTTLINTLVIKQALGQNVDVWSGYLDTVLRRNGSLMSYYKVAFVRNPVSRVLSAYRSKICARYPSHMRSFFIKYPELWHNMPFSDFVYWLCDTEKGGDDNADRHWLSQWQFIYKNERCLVDRVAYFENLESEWNNICSAIGVEAPALGLHGVQTGASDKINGERWSQESIQRVANRYALDLKTFGYEIGVIQACDT